MAKQAADLVKIPAKNILIIGDGNSPHSPGFETLENTILWWLNHPTLSFETKLTPGEARRKVAFLCFSSGTTGKPKVCNLKDMCLGFELNTSMKRRLRSRTIMSSRTLYNLRLGIALIKTYLQRSDVLGQVKFAVTVRYTFTFIILFSDLIFFLSPSFVPCVNHYNLSRGSSDLFF